MLMAALLLASCTKYEPEQPMKDAAYIRVFNSITTNVEPTDGGILPFLTFMMDPAGDAKNGLTGAEVMCDYLNTRQLSSQSYPTDADTDPSAPSTIGSGPSGQPLYTGIVNFEYPGKYHVPAAPAMNGFDMSSWAQVKPGKHRIVFVVRPKNNTPFAQLDQPVRQTTLIDTTIELKAGEVYTLEAVQISRDAPVAYALYARQENFFKKAFDGDKIYVGFDNISGNYPKAAQAGFLRYFSDTVNIYYSYLMRDVISSVNATLPILGMNNLLYSTISTKRSGEISNYLALPMLPRSYFFYKDSTIKTFPTHLDTDNTTAANNGVQKDEDLPFVRFDFYNYNGATGKILSLNCSANPVTLPFYDPNIQYVRRYLPNLNLIINNNNKIHIYPTVSILEICYDRVYMLQMQRAFNEVPR